MASKYLSIEEAVELLGIPQDEINRLREAGELRGFADRGTWKFRSEDVEEFRRSRQADSSDDGGLGADDLALSDDEFDDLGTTSLLDDDEGVSAEQPTLVQSSLDDDEPLLVDESSDSDVRLVIDESLELEAPLAAGDDEPVLSEDMDLAESDSDVRLVADESPAEDDPPLLAESDSEVRLVSESPSEDDGMAGSDSDVKLVTGDRLDATVLETPRAPADLDVTEIAEGSGVSLDPEADSGISLEAVAESGISLEMTDESGISLEPSGSGVELGSDVTIADSGIALDFGSEESGISLDLDGSPDETQIEVPSLTADGTDDEMVGGDDDDGDTSTDTSVLLFDDEEDADDYSATVVKKSDDEDIFDDFGDLDDDDDLDVVDDDIFGDDDEVEDLDVFDADDDVFDDDGDDDYAVPVERIATTVEQEWGVGTFLAMLMSTGLMLVCGMVLYELVRSIWGWQDPGFSASLIDAVGGIFN